MNYRVAAYITSYEDPESLLRCVSAIQQQSHPIETILVVENSAHDNISSLPLEGLIVEHYPDNIGISGGLGVALKWFTESDYDFLWTFDQDSEALPDTLEKLLDSYDVLISEGYIPGIVAPKAIDHHTAQELHGIVFSGYRFFDAEDRNNQLSFYQCDAVVTSGSLISSKAAKESEFPSQGLFIDAVDWDYCFKLKDKGFSIFVIKDAILMHRLGGSEEARLPILNRKMMIQNYSPIRYFYISRNHTYVETRLAKARGKLGLSLLHRARYLVVMTVKIIFYEPKNKIINLWACYLGTFNGLLGKLGKTW